MKDIKKAGAQIIIFGLCLLTGCMMKSKDIKPSVTIIPELTVSNTPAATESPSHSITPLPIVSNQTIHLQENVVYEYLQFTDHVELLATEGKGWLLDLNGDGNIDKIYLNKKGLFINNQLVQKKEDIITSEQAYSIWVLDIDTEDQKYELMMQYGNILYVYDGKGLCGTKGILSMLHGGKNAIWNFERIDERTISFRDWHFIFDSYPMNASYRLNEKHELVVVPQEYILETPHLFAYVDEENELKLYRERDLQGEYVTIKGIRLFLLTKSDGVNWVYLKSPYYESGWIYCEETEQGVLVNRETTGDAFVGYNPLP